MPLYKNVPQGTLQLTFHIFHFFFSSNFELQKKKIKIKINTTATSTWNIRRKVHSGYYVPLSY